ncbi:HypC/HybG/HupF family hydrogenase formation chaperone [Tropicimonas sediminicola]|uniref:Hydrogenase maturation protein HypC n=1 Tax=Tropicimonas sediminicola TaxID=1031541 RepID=A0A239K401_9RHOB|nr:HypC/HybG/HupF family hydrogenase formation chaperone [Tropicimonas sediminicola]SNT12498.1 Hydrogenase maturation protein HypC [Tropicimonas sediminicola]
MCLAVPMRITAIDGYTATCEAGGVLRDANLFMMQGEDLAVGDIVLIHVGYAIKKVSEEEARLSWETFGTLLHPDA